SAIAISGPGASTLRINAASLAYGLDVIGGGANSTISNIGIGGSTTGIVITDASTVTVSGTYIGAADASVASVVNGIVIQGTSSGDIIGTPGSGNVIAGSGSGTGISAGGAGSHSI